MHLIAMNRPVQCVPESHLLTLQHCPVPQYLQACRRVFLCNRPGLPFPIGPLWVHPTTHPRTATHHSLALCQHHLRKWQANRKHVRLNSYHCSPVILVQCSSPKWDYISGCLLWVGGRQSLDLKSWSAEHERGRSKGHSAYKLSFPSLSLNKIPLTLNCGVKCLPVCLPLYPQERWLHFTTGQFLHSNVLRWKALKSSKINKTAVY